MLIPALVTLSEALEPIRQDLIQQYKGFKTLIYKDQKVTVEVKGAISFIICDHPQACEISHHLGVPAKMNGHMCWINKNECSKYADKIFNHRFTRRRLQTDLIVQQMKDVLSSKKKKKSKQEELQRETGIRCEACPLKGVEVDPHVQCYPDFDHFYDVGLCMRLFNFISNRLSPQEQKNVEIRLKSLPMPRSWNKFSPNLQSVSKKK